MDKKPNRKRSWLQSGAFSRLKKKNLDNIVQNIPSKPSPSNCFRPISLRPIHDTASEASSSSSSADYPQSPDDINVHFSDNENDTNEEHDDIFDIEEPISSDEEYGDHNRIDDDNDFGDLDGWTLRQFLQVWSVKYNIRHRALKSLLKGLITISNENLPQDPRTLLNSNTKSVIENMGDGQYWHQGLEYCLRQCFADLDGALEISLDINIDGLPIHNSSKQQFWPILCDVVGHNLPQFDT